MALLLIPLDILLIVAAFYALPWILGAAAIGMCLIVLYVLIRWAVADGTEEGSRQ